MNEKTLRMLEFDKVLERLAEYAAFPISAELARRLRPTTSLEKARHRQTLTREARLLLSIQSDVSIGGARDVRAPVDLAARGGVLDPADLLAIKNTLIAARTLGRTLEHHADLTPNLGEIGARLTPPAGMVDAISRVLSENGEVLDSASTRLSAIRNELKTAHQRLLAKLEHMINDPQIAPMLQEAIITQRSGRYVIPLRAEFKGRIRSLIHDQSSSGATLFIEPLAVVDLNNRYHELQLEERDEVRRILTALSAQVGECAVQIQDILAALGELDLALMCARYADDLRAAEPELVEVHPTAQHPGTTLHLFQARHPLLPPENVVPVDVVLDQHTFGLVITGPNTGGKTVTLKTVGLMVLMAQCGLHLPVQSGSALSVFRNVFADIGDEQSIEQSLSTFSGHIHNIVRILRFADRTSLILLDELGAGTDPQEGSALARALLAYLVQRRVTCLVATHYPELKAFAHATPGITNASMEFDLQTLRPTYRLLMGLPGRSNALLIAERLGMPKEVLETARAALNPQDLRAEDLLDEIHRQRNLAEQARRAAEQDRREAERLRAELEQRLEKIENERQAILEETHRKSKEELAALRNELEELRRELRRAHQPLQMLKPLQEQMEALEVVVEQASQRHRSEKAKVRPLQIGDRVRLRALDKVGQITDMDEDGLEVQIGALRVRAKKEDIQSTDEDEIEVPSLLGWSAESDAPRAVMLRPSPGIELDIRGKRADDALDELERYLEQAYLAGLPYVRIIHGKGTGRLRQVIRQALERSSYVERWEIGLENEGGEGVTVAHLKS
jgi:DNA mismatch repair protein MutS2